MDDERLELDALQKKLKLQSNVLMNFARNIVSVRLLDFVMLLQHVMKQIKLYKKNSRLLVVSSYRYRINSPSFYGVTLCLTQNNLEQHESMGIVAVLNSKYLIT